MFSSDAGSTDNESLVGNPDFDADNGTTDDGATDDGLAWDGTQAIAEDVTRELIFIDTSVEDFDQLLDDIASLSDPSRRDRNCVHRSDARRNHPDH